MAGIVADFLRIPLDEFPDGRADRQLLADFLESKK